MHNWRAGLILSLCLLSLSLAGCWLVQGGSATSEEGGKGETLESPAGGFEWRREGGIAGFCDVVTVAVSDEAATATIASCRTDPPQIRSERSLSAAQARLVAGWVAVTRSFERTESNGAVADGMTITWAFIGQGDAAPTDSLLNDLTALVNEIMAASRED